MLQPHFGQNLKRLVEASPYTRSQLAKRCNLAPVTIRRLIAGRHEPDQETIKNLLDGLGATGHQLHRSLAGLRGRTGSADLGHEEVQLAAHLARAGCFHAGFSALSHYAGVDHAERGIGPNPSTSMDMGATLQMLEVLLPGIVDGQEPNAPPVAVYGEELDGDMPLSRAVTELFKRYSTIKVCRSAVAFAEALTRGYKGWLFDATDGSVNALNQIPFFSSAAAFVVRGVPRVGAVYDPVRGEMFYALPGRKGDDLGYIWSLSGGWYRPLSQATNAETVPVIGVHFSRQDDKVRSRFARFVGSLGQRFTIAAYNSGQLALALVSAQKLAAYVNPSTSVWDCAAGECLVRASRVARITTFGGQPISYLSGSVRTSVVAAASAKVHAEILEGLAKAGFAGSR